MATLGPTGANSYQRQIGPVIGVDLTRRRNGPHRRFCEGDMMRFPHMFYRTLTSGLAIPRAHSMKSRAVGLICDTFVQ
jgi:hypothetical protein